MTSTVPYQACYLDPLGRILAYNFLQHACSAFPVHLIYGAIDDYMCVHPGRLHATQVLPGICGES